MVYVYFVLSSEGEVFSEVLRNTDTIHTKRF